MEQGHGLSQDTAGRADARVKEGGQAGGQEPGSPSDLLMHLEGIVHFADGFACYHNDGPAGQALREWINGARYSISKATGADQ